MKKYLIVLIGLLILAPGCSINNKKIEKKSLGNDLVISYNVRSNYGLEDAPSYEIKVYGDKYITYGYSNLDGFYQANLNDEQYQEIVDYVQSDKFLSLDSDLTDSNFTDGNVSHIVIYYSDNTVFKTGGSNVTNETYLGLIKLLEKYKN